MAEVVEASPPPRKVTKMMACQAQSGLGPSPGVGPKSLPSLWRCLPETVYALLQGEERAWLHGFGAG